MKLLIGGGGTGGHVYPAIAIARELVARGEGHEAMFVGAQKGLETRLVPKEGFEIKTLNVTGIKGKGVVAKIVSLVRLGLATIKTMKIILDYKPDVALGVGGFASGPLGIAAALTGRPLALAEQNAHPGMTNRWLGRFAKKVFLTSPGSESLFPSNVGMVTGNPIRLEFFEDVKKDGGARLKVFMFGGSQGARTMNKAFSDAVALLNEIADKIEMTVQTGEADHEMVNLSLKGARFPFTAQKYFDDMPERITGANLVISRAGAGSIAEINAVGKAAVYVPYPWAADDHQTANAKVFENAGCAIVVNNSDFDGDRFFEIVKSFIDKREQLEEMGEKAKTFATPNAAKDIVDQLLLLSKEPVAP